MANPLVTKIFRKINILLIDYSIPVKIYSLNVELLISIKRLNPYLLNYLPWINDLLEKMLTIKSLFLLEIS